MIWMSLIYLLSWIMFWLIPQEKNKYAPRHRVYTIEQSDMKKLVDNLSKMGLDDSRSRLKLDEIFNDTLESNRHIYKYFYPMYLEKNVIFKCSIFGNSINRISLDGLYKFDYTGHLEVDYLLTQWRNNTIFKQYCVITLFEDTVLQGVRYECKPIVWSWWWLIGAQYDFYILFSFIPYLIVLSIWGAIRINQHSKRQL